MKKLFLIVTTLIISLFLFGCSSSFHNYNENNGDNSWDATYEKFDGHRQREITIKNEGEFVFTVDIVTNSGTFGLNITDENGTTCYRGKELPSSSFKVQANSGGKYIIRLDADNHSGSFDIKW